MQELHTALMSIKKEAYGSHSPDWVMKFISKEKEKVPD